MKFNKILSNNCHLWNNPNLSKEDLIQDLEIKKVYLDDSHFIRKLLQCKDCGQLYFYEFLEESDLEGQEEQFRTWIPVPNVEFGAELSQKNPLSLFLYPAIKVDFKAQDVEPSNPYHVKGAD